MQPIMLSCTLFIVRLQHLFTAQRRFLRSASGGVNWTLGRMCLAQPCSLTLLYWAPAINAASQRAKGITARLLATEITAASNNTPEKNIETQRDAHQQTELTSKLFLKQQEKEYRERRGNEGR